MKISLVIPMYNEEKIISDTMRTVTAYMDKTFLDYEVLFVDDGSRDNTLSLARVLETNRVKVLTYGQNQGKGYAIRTGMLAACGDFVFFTDCDLGYGLDVIREGVSLFEKNHDADIVIGSRKRHPEGYESYTFLRKAASKTFMFLLRKYGGIKVSDSQTGLKGFKLETAKKIFPMCEINRFSFDIEVLLIAQNLKCKIVEMPVKIINHGASSVNLLKDGVRMFRDVKKIKKAVKQKFKI